VRLQRFRCSSCGLQILLDRKPAKCFCCGSIDIVREGWKQRYLRIREEKPTKEMMQ